MSCGGNAGWTFEYRLPHGNGSDRNENIGSETAAVGTVSSISEGDTSTSFQQYVDNNFKDTVLKNYKFSLNRYRKVAWK